MEFKMACIKFTADGIQIYLASIWHLSGIWHLDHVVFNKFLSGARALVPQ